jgi:PIN domain nuclease of toxin-antitoxin system
MTPRLLDTQLLLWLAVAPERLPVPLRQLLQDRQIPSVFCAASLWEVAVMSSLGKPSFQVDARALRRGLLAEGLQELPLAVEHCLAVQHLPREKPASF